MKKSEQETLAALVRGDHKAFDELFVANFNKVRFFIHRLIKSEAEAEELAQTIFVKLWTSRALIDPTKPFGAYLFTMARNAVYNHIKHKRVRSDFVNSIAHLKEETVCTEVSLHAKELNQLLDGSVERMPDQRRKIFRLSRQIGLSNGEIADRLSISKKTVENQLSLALQELRKTIHRFLLGIVCFCAPIGISIWISC